MPTSTTVIGDKHCGTHHNFKVMRAEGRCTHMAAFRSTDQAHMKGVFHASQFHYNPPTGTFICPAKQRLTKRSFNKNENGWYYRVGKKVCGACPT